MRAPNVSSHGLHAASPEPVAGAAPRPGAFARALAAASPPGGPPAQAPPETAAPVDAAALPLDALFPELVRKVAWGGDGLRGAVRLELGAGELSGASVVIQASGGEVDVTLSAPAAVHAAVDLDAWRDRVAARLAARGIHVGAIDVY